MALKTVLGIGLTLLGFYGSLATAFQFLVQWRSGKLRDSSSRFVVALVCKCLGLEVWYASGLLAGLSLMAQSVWAAELHTVDVWWNVLFLTGLAIYTIGALGERQIVRS